MNKEQSYTFKDHDCWDHPIWGNTATYNYMKCFTCDKILKFRFKSFLTQLRMIFWNRIN